MMEIRNLLVKEYPLKYMIEYPSIHLPEFHRKYPTTYHTEFIRYIPRIYLLDYPLAYKIPYTILLGISYRYPTECPIEYLAFLLYTL